MWQFKTFQTNEFLGDFHICDLYKTNLNGDIICSDLMCELTVNFFKNKKMKLFLEFFSAADSNSGIVSIREAKQKVFTHWLIVMTVLVTQLSIKVASMKYLYII